MEHEPSDGSGPDDTQDDQDRVVSRRVRNPTAAEPDDDAVYRAANPPSDEHDGPTASGGSATGGASTTDAAAELAEENESEPSRSE